MNIIFLGGFFPKQSTDEIIKNSKHQVQSAANTFQWALIDGFMQTYDKPLNCITAPFIGWYPKYYNKLHFKSKTFKINSGQKTNDLVGFINLPILKNFNKYFAIKKKLQSYLSSSKNVIIIYALHAAYLMAAIDLKKRNSNIKICVIVPDLHEFPGGAQNFYKLYIKHIERIIFYKLLNQIDYFVVLTDAMIDFLKITHKDWIRIEGIYTQPNRKLSMESFMEQNDLIEDNQDLKIILYTGSLDPKYGLYNLLDAFSSINSAEFRLWICGGGNGVPVVKKKALTDKRIKYLGLLKRDLIIELQKKATLLINPRTPDGEYTKYSFPSKTMEYFASGTPTLMYRLPGVPDEYYQYCYTVIKSGTTELARSLKTVSLLDKKELELTGLCAKKFIEENKDAITQTQKILALIM